MICDERDYYYQVKYFRYHGAERVPCYRYFDNVPDARAFSNDVRGNIKRVSRTVAHIYIVGGNLYGET